MSKVTILGSVAALALSGNAFAADHAVPAIAVRHAPMSRAVFPHKGKKILYNQNDNDKGLGIPSQGFDDSYVYDCQGADDFVLRKSAEVTEIDVPGIYFNGEGTASSFNVFFYSGDKAPGKIVSQCKNASYTDTTGHGSPNIKCKASLKKGKTYWLSIQANIKDFNTGEWGWNLNEMIRGKPAMWQNPGEGIAGCPTWMPLAFCSTGAGGDFSFALLGKEK